MRFASDPYLGSRRVAISVLYELRSLPGFWGSRPTKTRGLELWSLQIIGARRRTRTARSWGRWRLQFTDPNDHEVVIMPKWSRPRSKLDDDEMATAAASIPISVFGEVQDLASTAIYGGRFPIFFFFFWVCLSLVLNLG